MNRYLMTVERYFKENLEFVVEAESRELAMIIATDMVSRNLNGDFNFCRPHTICCVKKLKK